MRKLKKFDLIFRQSKGYFKDKNRKEIPRTTFRTEPKPKPKYIDIHRVLLGINIRMG